MPSSPLASWACTAGDNVDASRSRLNRTESNGEERSFIRRAHCPIRIGDPAGNNGRRAPHRRCAAPWRGRELQNPEGGAFGEWFAAKHAAERLTAAARLLSGNLPPALRASNKLSEGMRCPSMRSRAAAVGAERDDILDSGHLLLMLRVSNKLPVGRRCPSTRSRAAAVGTERDDTAEEFFS